MSLFGDDEEAQFEGEYKRAIRKRLLDETRAQRGSGRGRGGGAGEKEAMAHIINNVYGGAGGTGGSAHSGGGGSGGVMDRMGGGMGGGDAPSGEDPFDYLVDISRSTIPENGIDPATGEAMPAGGWYKRVHRHREKKK